MDEEAARRIVQPRPLVMGILNVTPDSFSDGGRFSRDEEAIEAGLQMAAAGADWIDVGGESSRPGAQPVSESEEVARVAPVVAGLVRHGLTVSIDTAKAAVAYVALDLGAAMVNDITALRDPAMRRICADFKCQVCLMHMQGTPVTMQSDPRYDNVVDEVSAFLRQRAADAVEAGVSPNRIWLDPGIGFGKTVEHNLALLRNLQTINELGFPTLVGVSRKGFLGRLGGDPPLPIPDRLPGTLAGEVIAVMNGATMIRTHDVVSSRRALDVAYAILSAGG